MTLHRDHAPIILTAAQQAVVEWGDGPLIVLGGAGTGKTTVIVERVRHLLAADASLHPEQILVLTTGVRAAAELSRRFEQRLAPEVAARLSVYDFHAFSARILTGHLGRLGLRADAGVLDGIGQRLLLRELRPRLGHLVYHPMARDPNASGRFVEPIDRARDELVTPQAYHAFAHARREAFRLRFGDGVFEEVVETLRRREMEGRLWQVRAVRRELGRDAGPAHRIASREARRDAVGGPRWWTRLDAAQTQLAHGLEETYLRDAEALDTLRLLEEAEVYALYQATLRERGLLDAREQQLRAIGLLMDRPDISLRDQRRFRHVLVAGVQDASVAQLMLVELVGRGPDKPDNVVVVGDDDLSTSRFRGASSAAFEQFRTRFNAPPAWAPDRTVQPVATLQLLESWRSTPEIVAAASRLVGHDQGRLKAGTLTATRAPGAPVELVYALDEEAEADAIAAWIRRTFEVLSEPRRWRDIAVVFRKHRHCELIVDRLRRLDVPHIVLGPVGLLDQAETRDVESALHVIANPDDSVAFVRLLSAGPWRVDALEILRLTRAADRDGQPVFRAAQRILREGLLPVATLDDRAAEPDTSVDPGEQQALWSRTEDWPGDAAPAAAGLRTREGRARWRQEQLETRLRVKLERVFSVLDPLVASARLDGPLTILQHYLARTGLLHDLLATGTPEALRAAQAIARFERVVAERQRAQPRCDVAGFVAYLDLYRQVGGDLDLDLDIGVDADADAVQLMTIHQAQGREFRAVAVPRLVEGQLPDLHEEAQLIPVDLLTQVPPSGFSIAEERRLAFVAMTRARDHLLLTVIDAPDGRQRPSRFAGEIRGGTASDDRHDHAPEPPGIPAVISPDEAWPGLRVERHAALPAAHAGTEHRARTTPHGGALALPERIPVARAAEPRFALRRRAAELVGALEAVGSLDADARSVLMAEFVGVAEAATVAGERGSDAAGPVTLDVLAHRPDAGRTLLEIASLPDTLSHSQMAAYRGCPLCYAFERVYRIPVAERKGFLEFGSTIHAAFEAYTRARRDALTAGAPRPDFSVLSDAFDAAWQPHAYADAQAAEHYRERSGPALRRFFERELAIQAEPVDVEVPFTFELDLKDGGSPVRFNGMIDRIDRHPDGSLEVIDYKTGRPRSQREVDDDPQLSAYALALASGVVRDPRTGLPLPSAARLTLLFVETDQAISTTRTPRQLDEFRRAALETARRIRAGDFAATPSERGCGWCDFRELCPSCWGTTG